MTRIRRGGVGIVIHDEVPHGHQEKPHGANQKNSPRDFRFSEIDFIVKLQIDVVKITLSSIYLVVTTWYSWCSWSVQELSLILNILGNEYKILNEQECIENDLENNFEDANMPI